MTNAEKYLKENVYVEDILSDFGNMYADNELEKSVLIIGLKNFFEAQAKEEQAKPTLTEDERVVLKNIDKKFIKIARDDRNSIYFIFKDNMELKYYANVFDNIFQFIKERRRI